MADYPREVLICQNRTCRKQGAAKILAAFEANLIPNVTVKNSSCLGKCGNGPMVLILPDQVWYCRVQPDEVPVVVERHLRGGVPVKGMLFHG